MEKGGREGWIEGGVGADVLNVGPRLLFGLFIKRRCILIVYCGLAAALDTPHGRYGGICVGGEEEEEEG